MNYVWKINGLESVSGKDGKPEIVKRAHWGCYVQDGDMSAEIFAICDLKEPDETNFIDYENLTELQVLNWVWESGVDKDSVEQSLYDQILNKKSPPIINSAPPWSS